MAGSQIESREWALFRAAYISSSTLRWLEAQEQEAKPSDFYFRLNSDLGEVAAGMSAVVEAVSKGTQAEEGVVKEACSFMELMNHLLRMVVEKAQAMVANDCPESLRQAITAQLDVILHLSSRIIDVIEVWQLSMNPEQIAEIASRVAAIDRSKPIPDWRAALELLSD